MNRGLKVLAIAVLALTVAAAGAVLYALNAMTPEVVGVQAALTPAAQVQDWFFISSGVSSAAALTPAAQVQDTYNALVNEVENGTFAGMQFAPVNGLNMQDCTFITYTLRLKNRGFFPAEWISMKVQPAWDDTGRDIVQLGDTGAYVLGAGATGDLSATILRAGDAANTRRTLDVTCYVFGQRVEFAVEAQ